MFQGEDPVTHIISFSTTEGHLNGNVEITSPDTILSTNETNSYNNSSISSSKTFKQTWEIVATEKPKTSPGSGKALCAAENLSTTIPEPGKALDTEDYLPIIPPGSGEAFSTAAYLLKTPPGPLEAPRTIENLPTTPPASVEALSTADSLPTTLPGPVELLSTTKNLPTTLPRPVEELSTADKPTSAPAVVTVSNQITIGVIHILHMVKHV